MGEIKFAFDEISDSPPVEQWLDGLAESTKKYYELFLSEFCLMNDLRPEEMLRIIFKEEEKRIPYWERQINQWFKNFEEHLRDKKVSKRSCKLERGVIKGFFHFHGFLNTPRTPTKRRRGETENLNEREGLKKSEIRQMIEAAKNWKTKSIILIGVSSGLSASDIINITVKQFKDGIIEVYDNNTESYRRICQLSLTRKKTGKRFTTFLSEEAVNSIEKYLEHERTNIKDVQPLIARTKDGTSKLGSIAIMKTYIRLNEYLGWEQEEKGQFRKATSHMMRKYFNTQFINAGMPEEVRKHLMGHELDNKVRDTYYMDNPEDLKEIYVQYMGNITIGPKKAPVSKSEYLKLKMDAEAKEAKIEELEKQMYIAMKELEAIKAKSSLTANTKLTEERKVKTSDIGIETTTPVKEFREDLQTKLDMEPADFKIVKRKREK